MQRSAIVPLLLLIPVYFFACHSPAPDKTGRDSSDKKPVAGVETLHNPEYRQQVKKEAVAEYKEDINDHLNNWSFSVRLYETSKTVYYRVKMKYEELQGEDTLRLPDLGVAPRPVLQKGKDKYSCIIGFLDNDNTFREYKLVYVNKQELGIKTLKHYSVTQGYKLVSQEVQ